MATRRRKNLIASLRRVEDEGEEEGVHDDHDDDSLSEGSINSDEEDAADGSETSQVDESPVERTIDRTGHSAPVNAKAKASKTPFADVLPAQGPNLVNGTSDTDLMMSGLSFSAQQDTGEALSFDDLQLAPVTAGSPAVVSSTAQMDSPQETPVERRRREHEDYKKKRDADPAFVPNRGAFFMHDHRHAGPAANGFRPFGRGRGGARGGRAAIGGPFAPMK